MKDRLRSFFRSVRFRLTLWFIAVLAVVLALFSAFVYARQVSDLNRETLDRLNVKTREWETYLKYGARGSQSTDLPLIPKQTREGEPFLQTYDILAITALEGQVIKKVGPIRDQDLQELVQAGMEQREGGYPFSFTVIEASTEGRLIEEKYRFVVAPISIDHQVNGYFILGSPLDPTGSLKRLVATLILGNLATLGLALAGGTWLSARAMRPVQMITRAAREIGETDLSRRLNLKTEDELGELAATFDDMLARLQAAFDRQRQFTADASHELRTPLTIIGLEADRALAARRPANEYRRALEVIRSENEWVSRLVNNLLTLSRMDAGQAGLSFETLDLSDVTLEIVERLEPLAERRGIALSTGALPEVQVTGDRQYLGQMIANLVENAMKYSRPDRAQVRVETGIDPQGRRPSGWVRVEDNGPGIASEHLPRLFDRFYQVDPARTHSPADLEGASQDGQPSAGSGLGLAIVQWIAQAHGGQVTVQSEVGEGTLFTVRLPLAERD